MLGVDKKMVCPYTDRFHKEKEDSEKQIDTLVKKLTFILTKNKIQVKLSLIIEVYRK